MAYVGCRRRVGVVRSIVFGAADVRVARPRRRTVERIERAAGRVRDSRWIEWHQVGIGPPSSPSPSRGMIEGLDSAGTREHDTDHGSIASTRGVGRRTGPHERPAGAPVEVHGPRDLRGLRAIGRWRTSRRAHRRVELDGRGARQRGRTSELAWRRAPAGEADAYSSNGRTRRRLRQTRSGPRRATSSKGFAWRRGTSTPVVTPSLGEVPQSAGVRRLGASSGSWRSLVARGRALGVRRNGLNSASLGSRRAAGR